ncbi:MAG: thymidylate kinase [Cenarchaeum symbiont of Oopsacas minuta]|nr:thymidylate kinase [Cenarchaeum symbiont of Oopsacas minuta]
MPLIISIEGGDQAGKKTQSTMLAKALRASGLKVSTFSFPDYTTPTGKIIKGVLNSKQALIPQVIHCLMSANRWEHVDDIRHATKESSIVIMNRYYHSNLVYGMVNGIEESWLENLDAGLPKSDMVILLDVTQSESFRRKGNGRDRFENNSDFIRKVSLTYKKVAKHKGWEIIDAKLDRRIVHDRLLSMVEKRMDS